MNYLITKEIPSALVRIIDVGIIQSVHDVLFTPIIKWKGLWYRFIKGIYILTKQIDAFIILQFSLCTTYFCFVVEFTFITLDNGISPAKRNEGISLDII